METGREAGTEACSSLLELFTVCFKILKKTCSQNLSKTTFLFASRKFSVFIFQRLVKVKLANFKTQKHYQFRKEIWGAFHSTKTPVHAGCWISGNFQLRIDQHFQKFPKKRTTSRGILKFSKNFPGSFFSVQLCTWKFPEISVEWFAFRKFNRFPDFSNFSGKFLYRLPLFLKFRKFWLNGRRLWCTRVAQYFQGIF